MCLIIIIIICTVNNVYSPKGPLYDMSGHNDKVIAVDWSMPQFMLSGAADNELKIFRSSDLSIHGYEL